MLPESIQELVDILSKFPGIGRRSGQKLALDMLDLDDETASDLVRSVGSMRERVQLCEVSGVFCEGDRSPMLDDARRVQTQICIVEKPVDALFVEKSQVYNGTYHVLGKMINPLENVFPGDTNVDKLFQRIASLTGRVELILFLKSGFNTDATVSYIQESLTNKQLSDRVTLTRMAQGLPLYYDSSTLDQATITLAFEDRREVAR